MIAETLENLISELKQYSGELPGKEYPEYKGSKCYFKTFAGSNSEPGTKVWIYWWLGEDWETSSTKEGLIVGSITAMKDSGYMMYLPDKDDRDFDTIIHIPYPAGGEKCQPEAEWESLLGLLENKYVVLITDVELTNEEYQQRVVTPIITKWNL